MCFLSWNLLTADKQGLSQSLQDTEGSCNYNTITWLTTSWHGGEDQLRIAEEVARSMQRNMRPQGAWRRWVSAVSGTGPNLQQCFYNSDNFILDDGGAKICTRKKKCLTEANRNSSGEMAWLCLLLLIGVPDTSLSSGSCGIHVKISSSSTF